MKSNIAFVTAGTPKPQELNQKVATLLGIKTEEVEAGVTHFNLSKERGEYDSIHAAAVCDALKKSSAERVVVFGAIASCSLGISFRSLDLRDTGDGKLFFMLPAFSVGAPWWKENKNVVQAGEALRAFLL